MWDGFELMPQERQLKLCVEKDFALSDWKVIYLCANQSLGLTNRYGCNVHTSSGPPGPRPLFTKHATSLLAPTSCARWSSPDITLCFLLSTRETSFVSALEIPATGCSSLRGPDDIVHQMIVLMKSRLSRRYAGLE